VVSASNAKHELQDLQSLMLNQEAVRLIQNRPEPIQQVLHTLASWRQEGTRTLGCHATNGSSSCTDEPGTGRFHIRDAPKSFGRCRP
jgi:hypothetical protein